MKHSKFVISDNIALQCIAHTIYMDCNSNWNLGKFGEQRLLASEQNCWSSHSKSIWNDSFEKLQRNSFFFLSISSKDHWYVGFFLQFLILLNFKQPQCLRTLQPFPVELIGHFDLIKLKIYIYLQCNGLFVGYFN